ncbi:MAG: hypothetical protein H7098_11560 [Oligoflexus sp.]|nr:hypothetical protein [Pseudopedobacter sp.]
MKNNNLLIKLNKHLLMLTLALFSTLYTFAQDAPKTVDVNINAGGAAEWYGQPWVWAIGVAIFILVLVIVTRSNKSSEA